LIFGVFDVARAVLFEDLGDQGTDRPTLLRAHRLEAAATHGSTCPVSATKFRLGHGGNVGTVLTVGKHALLHPLPIFGPMFVAELYQNRIIGWRT